MTTISSMSAEQALRDRTGKKPKWDLERRQARFALLLLAPALLIILLFIGYPIVYSFLLTFSEFTVREVHWFTAGFSNYERVLNDRAFGTAFQFTLIYTVSYVPISIVLALLVGVLLQQIKIGTTFFRSLLFLPTVVPVTMGLLMFQWVLDPNNGIVNHLLANVFGLPGLARSWLADRDTVFGTLVAVTLWGFGPWILLLAGLLAIPKDYYEAARVDGAAHIQEFWFITLPQLRNTLMVVTTLQVIKALKIFVPIYVLTSGNPAGRTQSLYYLVFLKVNQGQNWYTYASTVGWVFTFIVIVITITTAFLFRMRRTA
ncbi:MAG TPA: sugar ABC transporter permease [Oceanobacillus sp.]|nr:sugar ABC transporter permease [Oceanobacillus sp.]